MAGLVDGVQQGTASSQHLVRLIHNPIFGDLQATLASECSQQSVPFTLVSDQATGHSDMVAHEQNDNVAFDLVVEDATLQAEFRQMSALHNPRVVELETFYNTQSAAIMTQRSDAMAKVSGAPPDRHDQELACVHHYYDRQQQHLTLRVSQSLQLLKSKLPMELAQPGGATKRNKSRLLCAKAVKLMADWYDRHQDNPYPTDEEKLELAQQGGISLSQVKAWFANKRNRSLNTRPKRQKMKMQQQLMSACEKLSTGAGNMCYNHSTNKNYNVLMHELSTLVQDTTPRVSSSCEGMLTHLPVI